MPKLTYTYEADDAVKPSPFATPAYKAAEAALQAAGCAIELRAGRYVAVRLGRVLAAADEPQRLLRLCEGL